MSLDEYGLERFIYARSWGIRPKIMDGSFVEVEVTGKHTKILLSLVPYSREKVILWQVPTREGSVLSGIEGSSIARIHPGSFRRILLEQKISY